LVRVFLFIAALAIPVGLAGLGLLSLDACDTDGLFKGVSTTTMMMTLEAQPESANA
jgi:hypothetical protein